MNILSICFHFIAAAAASAGFAMIFHTPKKAVLLAALIAAAGYAIYEICLFFSNIAPLSIFVAGIVIGLLSEVVSRFKKMPATVFVTVGLIPLVPGYGLYQTMMHLVQGQYDQALTYGVETVLIAGAIAVSVGACVGVFRKIGKRKSDT